MERVIVSGIEALDETVSGSVGIRQAVEIISDAVTPTWNEAGGQGEPLQLMDELDSSSSDSSSPLIVFCLLQPIQPRELAGTGLSTHEIDVGGGIPSFRLQTRQGMEYYPEGVAFAADGGLLLQSLLFLRTSLLLCKDWWTHPHGVSPERCYLSERVVDPIYNTELNYYPYCQKFNVTLLPDDASASQTSDVPVLFLISEIK